MKPDSYGTCGRTLLVLERFAFFILMGRDNLRDKMGTEALDSNTAAGCSFDELSELPCEEIDVLSRFKTIRNLTNPRGRGGKKRQNKAKRKKQASNSGLGRLSGLTFHLLMPGSSGFGCHSGPSTSLLSHANPCLFWRCFTQQRAGLQLLGRRLRSRKGN